MRRKWTRILLQRPFPELLRRQIAQAAHGPLLVEEADVIGDGLGDVLGLPDPEIHEHLGLGPSVDGFHRPVVGGRPYPGHRPHDIILQKAFVECPRRVHRALIRVEDRSQFGVLFF